MLNENPHPQHFNIIPRCGIIVTWRVLPKTRHVLPETRRVLVVVMTYAKKCLVQEVQVIFLLHYYVCLSARLFTHIAPAPSARPALPKFFWTANCG